MNPYLYQEISEGELIKVWNEQLPIRVYGDEDRQQLEIYDFLFHQKSQTLFLVEAKSIPDSFRMEEIKGYRLMDGKFIGFSYYLGWPPHWSGNELLNYYPETDQVLINTMGGDGCGGEGKVWLASQRGQEVLVLETAFGCVHIDRPRYLGFRENKLILARAESDGTNQNNSSFTEIYNQDIFNKSQNIVLRRDQIPEKITHAKISKDNTNQVVLSTANMNKNWLLELNTYEINPIDKPEP